MFGAQWASPPGYQTALQLAKLILLGATLDPLSSMGGQACTLSLSHIWERALRRMFDQFAEQTGWHRVADDRRTRRWDDLGGSDDSKRWLTADVIVERAGERWILDAKYKPESGEESRTDRFQVCAYGLAFEANRAFDRRAVMAVGSVPPLRAIHYLRGRYGGYICRILRNVP